MIDPINNTQTQTSGLEYNKVGDDRLAEFYGELNSKQQGFDLSSAASGSGYDDIGSYDAGIEKGLNQNNLRAGNMDWKKSRAIARLPRDVFAEVLNTFGALNTMIASPDREYDNFGNIKKLDPLSRSLLEWGEYYKSNEGRNVELYTPNADELAVFDPLNDDWAAWAITNLAPTFGMMVASMGVGGVAKVGLTAATKGTVNRLAKKSLKKKLKDSVGKGLLGKEASEEVFDRLTATTIKEQTKGLARKEAKELGEGMLAGTSSYLDDVVGMGIKEAGEITSKKLRKEAAEEALAKATLRKELDDAAGRFLRDKVKNPLVDVGTAFTSAFVSRNGESLSESRQVYDATLARLKKDEPNLSKKEAEAKAMEASKRAYTASMSLMAIDFAQYFQLGKLLKGSTGLFKGSNKFAAGLKNIAFEGITEGLEEGIQFAIAKEAENEGTIFSDEGYVQTFFDSVDDKEFQQSFVQGMIGGIGFSSAGQAYGGFRNYLSSKAAEKFGKMTEDDVAKKMMEASEHPAAQAAINAANNEANPEKKEAAATTAAAVEISKDLNQKLAINIKALEQNPLYKGKGAQVKLGLEIAALYELLEDSKNPDIINELIDKKEELVEQLESKGKKEKEDKNAFTVDNIESIDNYENLLETVKEIIENELLIEGNKKNKSKKEKPLGTVEELQEKANNLAEQLKEVEGKIAEEPLDEYKETKNKLKEELNSTNKELTKAKKKALSSESKDQATEGVSTTVDTPVNTDTDYISDDVKTKLSANNISEASVNTLTFMELLGRFDINEFSDRVKNAVLKKFGIDPSKSKKAIDGETSLYFDAEGNPVTSALNSNQEKAAKEVEKLMGTTIDELVTKLVEQLDNPTGTAIDKILQNKTLQELEELYNKNAQPFILEEIESRIGQNTDESKQAIKLRDKLTGNQVIHESIIDFIENSPEEVAGIVKNLIIKVFDFVDINFRLRLIKNGKGYTVNNEAEVITIADNTSQYFNLLLALLTQIPSTYQQDIVNIATEVSGLDITSFEDVVDEKFMNHLEQEKLFNKFIHDIYNQVLEFSEDDLLYGTKEDFDKLGSTSVSSAPKPKPKSAVKKAAGKEQAVLKEGDPTSDTEMYEVEEPKDILMIESFPHQIATITEAKEENGYFVKGQVEMNKEIMSLAEFKKKYNFYTWKKNNGSHTLVVLDKITNVPLVHPNVKKYGIDLDYLRNTTFKQGEEFELEIDQVELDKYKGNNSNARQRNPDYAVIRITHNGKTIGILSGTAINKPVFATLMKIRREFLENKLSDSNYSKKIELGTTVQGTFVITDSFTTLSDHANGTEQLAVVNMSVFKDEDGKSTGVLTGSFQLGDKVLRGIKFSDQKGNVAVIQTDSKGNKYFFFARTKLVSAMPKIRERIINILEGDANTDEMKKYVKWSRDVVTKNGREAKVDAYTGNAKVKLEYTKDVDESNVKKGMRVVMIDGIEEVLSSDRKTVNNDDIIEAFDNIKVFTVESFDEDNVILTNGEILDFSEVKTYFVDEFMAIIDEHRVQIPRDNPNMEEHGDRLETNLVPATYTTPENMYFKEIEQEIDDIINVQQISEDQAGVNADILAGIQDVDEISGVPSTPEQGSLFDEIFEDNFEVTDEMFEDEETEIDDVVVDVLGKTTEVEELNNKSQSGNYGFFTDPDDTLEEGDTTCGV